MRIEETLWRMAVHLSKLTQRLTVSWRASYWAQARHLHNLSMLMNNGHGLAYARVRTLGRI